MPNILDATGLTLSTKAELISYYTTQFQQIYGADINLDSDSPDGQWMNIIVQTVLDIQDLVTQVYNSFDPDNAVGNILDQRVAINGIQRQAGTYTVTPITIVTNAVVNLYGLDQTAQQVYTVSDNAGTLWELQTTQLGVSSGTNVFNFQAATPGQQLTTPNTITTPVTIVLGVVSVNNPTSYLTLGVNEESDAVLKVRRQRSVSLSSQGYLAGLLAALENINGVTSAFVYENLTNVTDGDGVPGHSIWVIVAGTGAAASIANAIYTKRNAGCGMFGSISYSFTQVNGAPFTVYWDTVVEEALFCKFTATSINGTTQPDLANIISQLPTVWNPGVAAEVNVNQLATYVQQIDPNTLVTNPGLSSAMTQVLTLSGIAASGTFTIRYNGNVSAAINWNDSISTVQTKVQAVSGLAGAIVTGSISGMTLTFNLASIGIIQGLISVATNSLMTSAPAAITFSFDFGYVNLLQPDSKKNQFLLSSAGIYILPMILSPSTASVPATGTQQMTGLGGVGPFTYSFITNNSGGTIGSSSGLYTAGSTPSVFDTLRVTDAYGNTANAIITVT
jgi:hypothetical protein